MHASFEKLIPGLIAAALTAASACATTAPQQMSSLRQSPGLPTNEPPRLGSPSEVLTGDQLRAGSALTLFAAVRSLRHEFFRPTNVMLETGGTAAVAPSVYLNGVYSGEIDQLETIPLGVVEEVRFIRATQARGWWGPQCHCVGGVIHVRTKPLR